MLMPSPNWCALMEENGRMHIFEIVDEKIKKLRDLESSILL